MTERLPEAAERLLQEEPTYAHVATVNPDGSPHVTMVWADARDGRFVFNTVDGRQKVRNLERDPRVSVTIQDPDRPQEHIRIEGTAQMVQDGAEDHIDELAQRFLGEERYPWRREGERRVIVRVEADSIGGMSTKLAA